MRLFFTLFALLGMLAGVLAQTPLMLFGVGIGNSTIPFTASCSQSTTYLAALSGASLAQMTAFDTAICGLVTDGNFAKLDGLYFFANSSDANAKVNVINPGTFNLTEHGTCTFTANQGITGDGSTCYEDTGFNAFTAGGQFGLNTASYGVCILNSRTVSAAINAFGAENGAVSYTYFQPLGSGQVAYNINGLDFPSSANIDAQGSWTIDRTTSVHIDGYFNGTFFTSTNADTAAGPPSLTFFILGVNNVGTVTGPTTDQVGYAFYGGTLGSTAAGQVYTRLHTMMAALGNTAC